MAKNPPAEYFCVCVRRTNETVWRPIRKYATRAEAEAEIERRKGYTGDFNYNDAELKILSRAEGKAEFGKSWEYKPIGGERPVKRPEPVDD